MAGQAFNCWTVMFESSTVAGLMSVISDAFRRLGFSHNVSRGGESESGE